MNTMTVLPPDTAYLVGINVFGFSAGTPEPTAIPDTETLPVLCDLRRDPLFPAPNSVGRPGLHWFDGLHNLEPQAHLP